MKTDIITLPMQLKKHGYTSAYVGKWHLGYGPYTEDKRYGFDYMAAYNMNKDAYTGSYHKNEEGSFKFDKWHPEQETDMAIEFIEEHTENSDEPFMLMMSWLPPHWPYETFPEEYDIYSEDDIEHTPNIPDQLQARAKKETALYYGNITALDALMGRVMDCTSHK